MAGLFDREFLLHLFAMGLRSKLLDWAGAKHGKHYRTKGASARHGTKPRRRVGRATGPGSYSHHDFVTHARLEEDHRRRLYG